MGISLRSPTPMSLNDFQDSGVRVRYRWADRNELLQSLRVAVVGGLSLEDGRGRESLEGVCHDSIFPMSWRDCKVYDVDELWTDY
jgi:hypothetical protein